MPLSYEIDSKRRVVFIEYWGFASVDETAEEFERYAADPRFAPGQIYLVDLTGVTGVERNFPKFMQFQAQTVSKIGADAMPSLMIYHAPTEVARGMAEMARKSWEGLDGPTLTILEDEASALAVAGCTETGFSELKRNLAKQRT